jgi:hypothetical protein
VHRGIVINHRVRERVDCGATLASAVLSCRLLDAGVVARALGCAVESLCFRQPALATPSSWGDAALLPLLALAAARHASLSGPSASPTVRSASSLALAAHRLPADGAALIWAAIAPVPPLAALVPIQAGNRALLGDACGQLSASELARLLWPALMIRRAAASIDAGRVAFCDERASDTRQPSGRWALASVVALAAARRGFAVAGRLLARLTVSHQRGAAASSGLFPSPSHAAADSGSALHGALAKILHTTPRFSPGGRWLARAQSARSQ